MPFPAWGRSVVAAVRTSLPCGSTVADHTWTLQAPRALSQLGFYISAVSFRHNARDAQIALKSGTSAGFRQPAERQARRSRIAGAIVAKQSTALAGLRTGPCRSESGPPESTIPLTAGMQTCASQRVTEFRAGPNRFSSAGAHLGDTLSECRQSEEQGSFLVRIQGGAMRGRVSARLSARRCDLRFPTVDQERAGHFVVDLSD